MAGKGGHGEALTAPPWVTSGTGSAGWGPRGLAPPGKRASSPTLSCRESKAASLSLRLQSSLVEAAAWGGLLGPGWFSVPGHHLDGTESAQGFPAFRSWVSSAAGAAGSAPGRFCFLGHKEELGDWKRFYVFVSSVFVSCLCADCLKGLGVRTENQRRAGGEVLQRSDLP